MIRAVYRIEVRQAEDEQWYFHVVSRRGGRVIAVGTGYNTRAGARHQARAFVRALRKPVEMERGGNLY